MLRYTSICTIPAKRGTSNGPKDTHQNLDRFIWDRSQAALEKFGTHHPAMN
jgi:hypothetical protein